MEAPNRIWIWSDDREGVVKGTWCHVQLYETDAKYISADLVDKLIGYAVHDDECFKNKWPAQGCSCGLSDLVTKVRHL